MSITIPLTILSDEEITMINKELTIKIEDKYKYGPVKYMIPFSLENDHVTIPFHYAVNTLGVSRPTRSTFGTLNTYFNADLRDEQVTVKNEAIKILNNEGSVILSMYCGFGKTITGLNIACKIRFRTLIVVNKIVLMTQWKQSITDFCNDAKIQLLKPGCELDPNMDFYIVNAINIEKFPRRSLEHIGTVIVDEAHLIMAERISKCLNHVTPRYLIGLTATPYRPDGFNRLLDFYFGSNKIIRELQREHKVYKVDTGFKPEIELGMNGKVNWCKVLESQAMDESRNDLIVDIIEYFKDRNILVLVKRVEHGCTLERMLKEKGETVTSLLGKNQTFDSSARILIGTSSKVGTGFDHPKLDTLLLAADVEEYFIQYLGRCMRTKDGVPYVIDLVDDNSILKKHYRTRKSTYIKHGGTIEDLKMEPKCRESHVLSVETRGYDDRWFVCANCSYESPKT